MKNKNDCASVFFQVSDAKKVSFSSLFQTESETFLFLFPPFSVSTGIIIYTKRMNTTRIISNKHPCKVLKIKNSLRSKHTP